MNISYSFGIVDFFHYGHLLVMQEGKKNADLHFFGLVSDQASTDWIGRTVSNYNERKAVLESVRYIDEVILQNTLDPLDNIKMLHTKYPKAKITVYHGNDWKIMPIKPYIDSIGGEIILTEYYSKMSPDKILNRLSSKSIGKHDGKNLISTKADTLLALKEKINTAKIEDIYILSSIDYMKEPLKYCKDISRKFGIRTIVIRSSSSNEDCFDKSNAGHYNSVLNIPADNLQQIMKAVACVISSYENDGLYGDQQILIQTQTENVVTSGVVFTRDIKLNRPYYVVNYCDNGSTDYVTSGRGGKTVWIAHDSHTDSRLGEWEGLIRTVKEIEELLSGMILDIEFALTSDEQIVIFQVRPLAANYKFVEQHDDERFYRIKTKFKDRYNQCISIYSGNIMMLSDMAFWNPSEIIGDNPKSLSFSIYREIITRNVWNKGLTPMGYNEVPKDLMYKIGNKPYISLDYSFMSLIPNDLGDEISCKLVNYYKQKLEKDLTSHDKIEFDIAITCYDFATEDRLKGLLAEGFTEEEIIKINTSLQRMTFRAIKDYNRVLSQDTQDINFLEDRRKLIQKSLNKDNKLHLLAAIKELLNNLKQYGTPQFSRQARYAFVAKSMCRTLEMYNYVNESDIGRFMSSIITIASEFDGDLEKYTKGLFSKEEFDERYGHLRSGTYDITSMPYSQINFSVGYDRKISETKNSEPYILDGEIIKIALADLNFELTNEEFINFLKQSFEQREYFKYEFTKSLSLLIEIIAVIGKEFDFSREELSYLDLADILAAEHYERDEDLKEFWAAIIQQRKNDHESNSKIVLPEVLQNLDDIDMIKISEARPNFITDKAIRGEIVLLEESMDQDIKGKIVVIAKADPGFDWVFAKGIKGLITKYGGVASHMAIRCAEFEIPAAIGCGEKIYNYVSNSKELMLDCKNRRILEEVV